MKLRTQLVIVFLLLSILPLTGIVLFSYSSSQKAFRRAMEKETRSLAAQMDTRVAGIRKDLDRRLERIGDLPVETFVAASDATSPSPDAAAVLAAELGESAAFLDRLEWMPDKEFQEFSMKAAPAATTPVVASVEPVAPAPPAAPAPSAVPEVPEAPAPPKPPAMKTYVIEIPRIEISANGEPVTVGSDKKTFVAPEGLDLSGVTADVKVAISAAQKVAKETAKAEEFQRKLVEREAERQAKLAQAEQERAAIRAERDALRREVSTVVLHGGTTHGVLKAQVREDLIVKKVLAGAAPESEDIAFAIDDKGTVLTGSEEKKQRLTSLDVDAIRRGAHTDNDNWVVATSKDEETGLLFGVARPVRESLQQMRSTAVSNFGWGLGLVALALFGIVPVANHLTRDIEHVMEGVDRIGRGDLESPVEVRSSNEIGRLATAFNRMASDLKDQQNKLLDEERKRQQQELEQRVLEVEYERKSRELEEAREFQLSLLPAEPPTHEDLEISVLVRTATEVGGDYYDYHPGPDGTLTLAIGDATGHGARAGTMVTVVKSLFAGRVDGSDLSAFLDEGNRTIRQMGLERMAMALTVARIDGRRLELASAGMPPALVFRNSSGRLDELQCEAPPLGSLAYEYRCLSTDLDPGDVILMMTDGFPELENPEGEPLGYDAMQSLFRDVAGESTEKILASFAEEAGRWTEGQPPSDDITFLAIRVKA